MKFKLNTEEVRYLHLFEKVTGANARDCIVDDNRVTFIVSEGEMPRAIGKGGSNVQRVEKKVNKKVDLVEYSKDPLQFVRNILNPIKPENVYLAEKSSGDKVINIRVDRRGKGAVFAHGRRLFKRLKIFLNRYHGISNIEVK